jgi:hypothetical protein
MRPVVDLDISASRDKIQDGVSGRGDGAGDQFPLLRECPKLTHQQGGGDPD